METSRESWSTAYAITVRPLWWVTRSPDRMSWRETPRSGKIESPSQVSITALV